MSLNRLRNEISSLRSHTRNLDDNSLGDHNWKRCFTRMLDELDSTLEDMDGRIENIESEIE